MAALAAAAMLAGPVAAEELAARAPGDPEAQVPAGADLVGRILVDFDGRHLGRVAEVAAGADGAATAVIVQSLPGSRWNGEMVALPVDALLLIVPDQPYLPVLPTVNRWTTR